MYTLSLLFPQGESFFVSSVAHFLDRLEDPQLRDEAASFMAQEGAHRREHARYNQRVLAFGADADWVDRRLAAFFRFGRRLLSPINQLAFTCTVEHFTAMMADELLRDERYLAGAEPKNAALWRWHCVEETEHKAVPFDVYTAVGGGFLRRALMMLYSTLDFAVGVFVIWAYLMFKDGQLFRVSNWRSALRFSFVRPGLVVRLLRPWLSWFRPGFHPWQHDNSRLIERWRAANPAAS